METKLLHDMRIYLDELCEMKKIQTEIADSLKVFNGAYLKRKRTTDGDWYYYMTNKQEHRMKYLGKGDCESVNDIKKERYLRESLSSIVNNIIVVEDALSKLESTDYESINEKLSSVYRGAKVDWSHRADERAALWKESAEALKKKHPVFRPEELIMKTDDGSAVRSKSEAMIYNYLLSMGVTFVYELPVRVGASTYYPDFTLLSEIDGKTEIIIEHQGMMGNDYYRSRFTEKLYNYLRAGYVSGVNIFFTFDKDNGGFDKTPIEDIVRNKIKMKH